MANLLATTSSATVAASSTAARPRSATPRLGRWTVLGAPRQSVKSSWATSGDLRCRRRVTTTRHACLVVVTRLLHRKSPLVAQLDFTDCLGAPRTVHLPSRGVALLGRAAVLDAATVADEVVASRFAIAVVARPEFHHTISLILGHALH